MAFSSERTSNSIPGNLRMETHSFDSASVTTGVISTGLSTILHVSLNNEVTEGDGKAVISGQKVTLSGLTSNDTGTIVVFGR